MEEQIRFKESTYDLVVNGAKFGDDIAEFIFLPGDKSYDYIESDITGAERIAILDLAGDTLESRAGYTCFGGLKKQPDYLIKTEQVKKGTDETGAVVYESQDSYGTVMIAVLKKTDIRKELENLKETVDMMVLERLGV